MKEVSHLTLANVFFVLFRQRHQLEIWRIDNLKIQEYFNQFFRERKETWARRSKQEELPKFQI